MLDIGVSTYLQTAGKDPSFKEVFVNGVLAGLSVQRELAVVGKVFYDGSLVEAVRNATGENAAVLIRKMGGMYEEVLGEGNFVGWDNRGSLSGEYAASFVKGMMWVCNLYQELTTVNLTGADIKFKLWDLVEYRMTELKEMI